MAADKQFMAEDSFYHVDRDALSALPVIDPKEHLLLGLRNSLIAERGH